ncbi:MAG: 4-alpha-glucanotransferase [Ignavibacteriales bacterium]|nr:4-alpha-glucanotransferase [Ignavibacteriales bacterium]
MAELSGDWDSGLVLRKKNLWMNGKKKLSDDILYQNLFSLFFFKQWTAVREYANSKGIKIIGDMPIFIAYDSADLWANKELFTVDENGSLETVAGVPPDYFSATGQLWGNPLYKWKEMEKMIFCG